MGTKTSNLRTLRLARGLTQIERAARCVIRGPKSFTGSLDEPTQKSLATPLSRHTIGRIEHQELRGENTYTTNMAVGVLMKLCRGLNVSPDELCGHL